MTMTIMGVVYSQEVKLVTTFGGQQQEQNIQREDYLWKELQKNKTRHKKTLIIQPPFTLSFLQSVAFH